MRLERHLRFVQSLPATHWVELPCPLLSSRVPITATAALAKQNSGPGRWELHILGRVPGFWKHCWMQVGFWRRYLPEKGD